jgi:hypothetical protein
MARARPGPGQKCLGIPCAVLVSCREEQPRRQPQEGGGDRVGQGPPSGEGTVLSSGHPFVAVLCRIESIRIEVVRIEARAPRGEGSHL